MIVRPKISRSQGLGNPCANQSDEGAETYEGTEGNTKEARETEKCEESSGGWPVPQTAEFWIVALSHPKPFVTTHYAPSAA